MKNDQVSKGEWNLSSIHWATSETCDSSIQKFFFNVDPNILATYYFLTRKKFLWNSKCLKKLSVIFSPTSIQKSYQRLLIYWHFDVSWMFFFSEYSMNDYLMMCIISGQKLNWDVWEVFLYCSFFRLQFGVFFRVGKISKNERRKNSRIFIIVLFLLINSKQFVLWAICL